MAYFNPQAAMASQLMGQATGPMGAWRGGLPPQMMTGGLPFRMNQYQGARRFVLPQRPQGATGLNVGSAQARAAYTRPTPNQMNAGQVATTGNPGGFSWWDFYGGTGTPQ